MGAEVLLKFLEIIFKTVAWLFIVTSILLFPLTLPVRLGMIVVAVAVVTVTPIIQRRRNA